MQKSIHIFLTYIAISVFLYGCSYELRQAKWCKRCTLKDSVTVTIKEVIKEVTVRDTMRLTAWLPNPCADLCDSLGSIKPAFTKTVTTDKGTLAKLYVRNGGLAVSTGIDGIKPKAAVTETTIATTKTVPARCELEHLSWWDQFWIKIGKGVTALLLLVGLGWMALRLLKRLPVG